MSSGKDEPLKQRRQDITAKHAEEEAQETVAVRREETSATATMMTLTERHRRELDELSETNATEVVGLEQEWQGNSEQHLREQVVQRTKLEVEMKEENGQRRLSTRAHEQSELSTKGDDEDFSLTEHETFEASEGDVGTNKLCEAVRPLSRPLSSTFDARSQSSGTSGYNLLSTLQKPQSREQKEYGSERKSEAVRTLSGSLSPAFDARSQSSGTSGYNFPSPLQKSQSREQKEYGLERKSNIEQEQTFRYTLARVARPLNSTPVYTPPTNPRPRSLSFRVKRVMLDLMTSGPPVRRSGILSLGLCSRARWRGDVHFEIAGSPCSIRREQTFILDIVPRQTAYYHEPTAQLRVVRATGAAVIVEFWDDAEFAQFWRSYVSYHHSIPIYHAASPFLSDQDEQSSV
ncbi:hypothetical protein L207DRAFT_210768 [Hyaloscypha variabilis F]|uniref:Uncharacterized protein n=1 Tax=Hyaloscypha variabilis (strain UAMH 11265 / GT02V1 / F) TaxID=1149755 RepID=A0A2J6S6F1_HYAVF|nr:hypothetical protein L207DRAFT_210768 [Hyaloscypha variabilis F]